MFNFGTKYTQQFVIPYKYYNIIAIPIVAEVRSIGGRIIIFFSNNRDTLPIHYTFEYDGHSIKVFDYYYFFLFYFFPLLLRIYLYDSFVIDIRQSARSYFGKHV